MRRPKQHPRRVHYGKRRAFVRRKIINKGIHYPIISKKAKLSQKKKNLFLYISNPKFFKQETGGYIDFNKKDMQRVWMEFAGKPWKDYNIVELPEEKDWEAMWHTHPDTGPQAIMPSDIDLLGFLKDNQDVNLIFAPSGGVLIINRSRKSKLPDKELKGRIKAKLGLVSKEISASKPSSQKEFVSALLKSLKRNFSDLGLRFDYTEAKSLNIPVEVREPRKNYGSGPLILLDTVDPSSMSESEQAELKARMFPKREAKKTMGRPVLSRRAALASEAETVKIQLESAKEKGDVEAIKFLEPELKRLENV